MDDSQLYRTKTAVLIRMSIQDFCWIMNFYCLSSFESVFCVCRYFIICLGVINLLWECDKECFFCFFFENIRTRWRTVCTAGALSPHTHTSSLVHIQEFRMHRAHRIQPKAYQKCDRTYIVVGWRRNWKKGKIRGDGESWQIDEMFKYSRIEWFIQRVLFPCHLWESKLYCMYQLLNFEVSHDSDFGFWFIVSWDNGSLCI